MIKNKAYWNKQIILEILRSCEFATLKDLCRISRLKNNNFSELVLLLSYASRQVCHPV